MYPQTELGALKFVMPPGEKCSRSPGADKGLIRVNQMALY